jgi:ABC-type multidrug transport system ATPase subunit
MLSLRNIVVSRARRPVIKGVSASAEKGDVVAVLGPNGSGKTTLLHFIAGVLKSDEGDISYYGRKIDTTSRDWRRILTYVLDDGGVINLLTVEEQIYLQSVLAGVDHTESIERSRRVIDLLQLNKYREYRGDELSSGVRKRLGIAMGIVRDADVFVFDEPYSSLDVQATVVFGGILKTLKNRGRIVLVASPSFSLLHDLYNHIWSLADGVVLDCSNEQEVRNRLDRPFLPGSFGEGGEIEIPWIHQST